MPTMPEWHFADARGVEHLGYVEDVHDSGGHDVEYRMRATDDGRVYMIRGSLLKQAGTTGKVVEMAEGGIVDGFEGWLDKVDAATYGKAGLSIHDLPDVPLRDWYDDGVSPARAAGKAITYAKSEGEMYQEGAVVEGEPEGVPAVIGEVGPEAVIPLDDPQAVEVMAEAIEEGGGGDGGEAGVVAAAEAVEAAAEAVEVVAVAGAVEEVAEARADAVEAEAEAVEEVAEAEAVAVEEVADAEAEVVEEVAEAEMVEAVADVAPRRTGFARLWWGE